MTTDTTPTPILTTTKQRILENYMPPDDKNAKIAEAKVITLTDLYKLGNLKIPEYQRPYKWTEKNVNNLIDDIISNKDKSEYRLGTLVLHQTKQEDDDYIFEIVDGQQRIITIALILFALNKNKEELLRYWENLNKLFENKLLEHKFDNPISQKNIYKNYQLIKQRINDFDKATVDFLLKKCTFVKIVLNDVSEAFQFFDSQNSRGKELEPHDLLKAYHLREMREIPSDEQIEIIEKWEGIDTDELASLFEYLYRIKNWSKLKSAREFTKDEISVFKGINLNNKIYYPYKRIFYVAEYFIEKIAKAPLVETEYPFQLDNIIINGKHFFEMIYQYSKLKKDLPNLIKKWNSEIYNILYADHKYNNKDYAGYYRVGDNYTKILFECACMYFLDKFGEDKELEKVFEKIFLWAFYIRLTSKRIPFSSIDNYAMEYDSFFKYIKEALQISDILKVRLKSVSKSEVQGVDAIVKYFEDKGLYKPQNS